MLRCLETGREWAGRRVQGAQEVCFQGRGVFVGDSFQPWLSRVRRGMADGVEDVEQNWGQSRSQAVREDTSACQCVRAVQGGCWLNFQTAFSSCCSISR